MTEPTSIERTTLYIAHLSFEQVRGDDREEGTFNELVQAPSVDDAMSSIRRYLVELSKTSQAELFAGTTKVFVDDVTEVSLPLARPALIAYESRKQPAESASSICCGVVDGAGVESYGWGPDGHDPEKDDSHVMEPFLLFQDGTAFASVCMAPGHYGACGSSISSTRRAPRSWDLRF
jgi:hypothetical protein